MKSGGLVDVGTMKIARTIGLIAPFVLFLYGWLIPIEYASNIHFVNMGVFLLITLSWIGVGLWQYLIPARTLRQHALFLMAYHIFAVLFVLLVAGFSAAFISGWALLCLMSFLYFQIPGFIVSAGILVFVATLDTMIRPYAFADVVSMYVNVILTIMVAAAAVAITMARANERRALKQSKQREEVERERILTLINNLADAVLSTDKNGVVSLYNAASLGLLDTNTAIDGKIIDEVFNLSDEDGKPVKLFERIQQAHSVTVDDTLRMQSGDDIMRLELTYAPIKGSYSEDNISGSEDGFILIARDVTRLKSLEEERDEFISVVSHELRTPVTVAEGTISNVQLMIERGQGSKKAVDASLSEAHEQIVYLAKMINDLSTLSRAERGIADETELIDVASMAHDLYNEYSPEAEKRGLHFNLELASHLGHVNTSRLYLHELLQNFITNAIKYTKAGSVTLGIQHKSGKVHFEVSDTGIGISKSDQAKIFDKFYRSEDYRTRETGGTGLGLYVASKLSRKIGTKIELKSRLNHGSSFSFKLPAHKTKSAK